jgi:uncharacterized protein YbjT (DUF2867 family)|tara:strand:- start:21406 stop:22380 length:975 start_codon:yes stop_codon:yes gene_type:complete
MTILVLGATGTLGRQVVKQLIDCGYPVRCLVRNIRKAEFLREWGAELVYGDLKLPETIPNTLKGITTIIDTATLRPEEEIATIQQVDLIGKMALIKAAKIAKIKKFIFFSISENEYFQSILLMRLKNKIENILKSSEISYTIFQIPGFYQGLITQYAIPILEQQTISTTQDSKLISFLDTRDIAKCCVKNLNNVTTSNLNTNSSINLSGPKNWTSQEIIQLCEEFSGQVAKVKFTSLFTLSFIKILMLFSKWTWEIHDRLAFSEILSTTIKNKNDVKSLNFDINSEDFLTLEIYLEDYFENMLKKLRDLNYDQNQIMKRKDLTF